MKTIGNLIWLIVVGLISFVLWAMAGLLWCITIIGIPFGIKCFQIGAFSLWPFGTIIQTNFDKHPIANILWLVLFGWEIALFYLVVGILLSITIIGIPFGQQCFKLATLSLLPFGAKIK